VVRKKTGELVAWLEDHWRNDLENGWVAVRSEGGRAEWNGERSVKSSAVWSEWQAEAHAADAHHAHAAETVDGAEAAHAAVAGSEAEAEARAAESAHHWRRQDGELRSWRWRWRWCRCGRWLLTVRRLAVLLLLWRLLLLLLLLDLLLHGVAVECLTFGDVVAAGWRRLGYACKQGDCEHDRCE